MFGGDEAYLRVLRQLQLVQLRHRYEADLAIVAGQHQLVAQPLDDRCAELFQREGIGHESDLRPTAYAGQRQLLRQCGAKVSLVEEAQRQLIEIAAPGRFDTEFAQKHRPVGIAERHAVVDANRLDRHVLSSEPATLGQVGG